MNKLHAIWVAILIALASAIGCRQETPTPPPAPAMEQVVPAPAPVQERVRKKARPQRHVLPSKSTKRVKPPAPRVDTAYCEMVRWYASHYTREQLEAMARQYPRADRAKALACLK